MRILPIIAVTAGLWAAPALAQGQQQQQEQLRQPQPVEQPGQPRPQEPAMPPGTGDALAASEAVRESQAPPPDETGTRAPEAQLTETAKPALRDALSAVYASPADLHGNPVQRPNDYGSQAVGWAKN